MATLFSFPIELSIALTLLGFLVSLFLLGGLRIIGDLESGLVITRFGRALPPGRLIALQGEAGYQPRLLPPGSEIPIRHLGVVVSDVPDVAVATGANCGLAKAFVGRLPEGLRANGA